MTPPTGSETESVARVTLACDLTPDLGGQGTTRAFTDRVVAAVAG